MGEIIQTAFRDASLVGNTEGFPADGIQIVTRQCFTRCEGDRVNQTVDAIPPFAESFEERGDLIVVRDIAAEHDVRSEL